jgi:hypothetical protein
MSKVILKNVRISFPRLFKAEGFQGSDQNKKYSANFILDADNPEHKKAIKQLKAAIDAVGSEKFGKKWKGGDMTVKGYCLKSADESLQDEKFVSDVDIEDNDGNMPSYAENAYLVGASETKRPTVVGRDKTPLTEEDGVIYGGCYVTAIINLWAQDNSYGKRVNANLLGVQFKKDGEAFATSESVNEDDFDDDFEDDDDDL